MSRKHPIISITGSSGAGTTSVKRTFEQIFRREKVAAAYIEGDAFHRYNRAEMRQKMAEEAERRNRHFRGPRIIATDRQAPRIYPRMIRLCSRFDSVLFTPKISEIPSYGNYSRSPLV